ncbi:Serine--tRNA ligase, mitochondrial [Xylographa opegraphella]|nr:Serine--tRNA ligase, mitochondrial [Xylographa opegraphella]
MALNRPVLGFSLLKKPHTRLQPPKRFSSSPSTPSRPSIAPKPNIDIKHIRQKPELHAQNCLDRNYDAQASHPLKIIALFDEWKALQQHGRSLREKNNTLRTKLSHSKTFSGRDVVDESAPEEDKATILEEARVLKQQIGEIEAQEEALTTSMEDLALELPNLTSAETPIGKTPRLIKYINEHPDPPPSSTSSSSSSSPLSRSHVYIASALDLIDFSAAALTSGWGFYYLKNGAALLEHALVSYALSTAMARGFTPITPPSLTYSHISTACGFRPRDTGGEQQVYSIAQSASDAHRGKPELSLAGTAEIPFAGMHASAELDVSALPLRVVGASRCYRAEAGSRGVDTKGLYRVHEFTKVEMFAWTSPADAPALFDAVVAVQMQILRQLGLHCRVLEQPTADLGASAVRKRDIEAFFPGRRERDGGWGEVTSASICTDYQTRRLATRMREADGRVGWPYTVNGTAVAVPRVLAALLENGWNEERECVRVPKCLWPWMHGLREIGKKRG